MHTIKSPSWKYTLTGLCQFTEVCTYQENLILEHLPHSTNTLPLFAVNAHHLSISCLCLPIIYLHLLLESLYSYFNFLSFVVHLECKSYSFLTLIYCPSLLSDYTVSGLALRVYMCIFLECPIDGIGLDELIRRPRVYTSLCCGTTERDSGQIIQATAIRKTRGRGKGESWEIEAEPICSLLYVDT